jgi:hypothetical protein
MLRISFSDSLAVIGIAATIILVALDKAGKLKGPVPIMLLGIAALMTLPLAVGNSWVSDATSTMLSFARGMLLICAVGSIYSCLLMWISTPETPAPAPSGPAVANVIVAPPQSYPSRSDIGDELEARLRRTQTPQPVPVNDEKHFHFTFEQLPAANATAYWQFVQTHALTWVWLR